MNPEKRAKLFDVAIREFVTLGFTQASLNRIISEVGMSKSSFYHYFANKTELFQQIMEQSLAPFSGLLAEFDMSEMTAENFWQQGMDTSKIAAGMFVENPQIILLGRMFYKSRESIKEEGLTSDFMDSIQSFIIQFLRRGQTLGVIRDDLPESLLLSTLLGLGMSIDQWMLENFHTIPQDEFEKFNMASMDMFVRLLAPQEVK